MFWSPNYGPHSPHTHSHTDTHHTHTHTDTHTYAHTCTHIHKQHTHTHTSPTLSTVQLNVTHTSPTLSTVQLNVTHTSPDATLLVTHYITNTTQLQNGPQLHLFLMSLFLSLPSLSLFLPLSL